MKTHRAVLLTLFLLLTLIAAPAAAQGDGTVFTDRFEVGIQKALVDDEHAWWRRGGEIRVGVPCDQAVEVQVVASPGGDWVFAFDGLPDGVSEMGNGRLAVVLDCDGGDVLVGVGAVSDDWAVSDGVLLVLFDGAPVPPTLEGIDLAGDGLPDVVNDVGVLLPDLAWVKDFPLTASLLGSVDSYGTTVGSIAGNEWTFSAAESGPYTITGHRDGLEDSGTGELDLREAVVTHLGAAPVVDTGSERVVSKELPCGEEYVGSFMTNTGDLVPAIDATYGAASTLPPNSSLSSSGEFTYTPSCSAGSPENVLFAVDSEISARGNNKSLEQVLVDIDVTGVESDLQIFGLDYDFNGQVNNQLIPSLNQIENEVPYFCDNLVRDMFIISNDPDNATYSILQGGNNAEIDGVDPNRLRFWAQSSNDPDCNIPPVIDSDGNVDVPGGLENTVVIQATSPLGSKTFSVDTRGYSPMITHVRVEPAPTSGGSPRDPYVANFDDNNFTEMINLSYDRPSGIPHNMYLVPVISHDDVALMRPTRNYTFEHNNQPFWMSLDMLDGVIDASPTASEAGPVFPRPEYTIKVGSTSGPGAYLLRLTVTDD